MKREREREEEGRTRPAKRKKTETTLGEGVVHVRSNGTARVYAEYALRCVAGPGACVRISGTGRAIAKTVAVVELTKAQFARAHAPHTLTQTASTLATVPVGDHKAPRLEIVLCWCGDETAAPGAAPTGGDGDKGTKKE